MSIAFAVLCVAAAVVAALLGYVVFTINEERKEERKLRESEREGARKLRELETEWIEKRESNSRSMNNEN